MPLMQWPLRNGRPCIEVVLTLAADGRPLPRVLLADTGAGSKTARFQLILDELDCVLCGGTPLQPIQLSGAYAGAFPTYGLDVRLSALNFAQVVRVVAVPTLAPGFDGIAGFRFLNRFSYGNFGDWDGFGLEA
jgi:hypothetical protein